MKIFKFIILLLLNFFFLPIYLFFYCLCIFASFLPIFPSKVAKVNLKEQMGYTGLKIQYVISKVYMGYVFYFFEVFIFEVLHLNCCHMQAGFSYKELIKGIQQKYPISKERGIVYILSHMANVEMYSLPVMEQFTLGNHSKVYALAQPSRVKWINKLLVWYRVRPGMGVLWTDKSLFSNMEQVITQEKASFCMLVDQKPKAGGLFIHFFKKYAAFPVSGLRMCMNNNMIVVYASAYRVLPGFVKMKMQCGKNPHLKEINQINFDSTFLNTEKLYEADLYHKDCLKEREKNVSIEMSYFVHWIENEIKNHPTQWCWDYKKWSREPIENSRIS